MGFGEKMDTGLYRARYHKLDGTLGSLPGRYKTKRLAAKAANDEEARVRKSGLAHVDPRRGLQPFGEWAAEWMEAQGKRPATRSRRRYLLRTYLLPEWQHTQIGAFSWPMVERWALTTDPISETSVRQAISLLSSILTAAVDAGKLDVNLLYRRRWSGHAEPADSTGTIWAHPDAVIRIAERLSTEAEQLMVLISQFAGPRYGELCALHRDNCLVERTWRLNGRDHTYKVLVIDPKVGAWHEDTEARPDGSEKVITYLGPPKNRHSARDVYLPPFLVDRIARHLRTWPHDYPFSTPSGTKWLRTNWNGRVLGPAADGREGQPARELPHTKWQSIASDIVAAVRAGSVGAGATLPTLVEQAQTHHAGRATVQKAITWLVEQGVLDNSGYRTVVAAEPSDPGEPTTVIPAVESWEPIVPGWRLHGGRHWCKSAMEDGDEFGELPKVFQRRQLGHEYKGIDGRYTHIMVRSIERFTALMERHWVEATAPDEDPLQKYSRWVEIAGEKRRHTARPRRSEPIRAHSSVG